MDELYKKATKVKEEHLIELRLDSVKSLNPKDVPSYFSSYFDRSILTYRSPTEGGMVKDYRISTLIQLIEVAKESKPFLFDVEGETLKKLGSVDISGIDLLISSHFIYTKPTKQDLEQFIAENMPKAKYIKVVNQPTEISEAIELLSLYSNSDAGKLIAFSMGDRWSFTRYISVLLGAPLMYSHPKGERVVEGMPDEDEAELYVKFASSAKNWTSTAL